MKKDTKIQPVKLGVVGLIRGRAIAATLIGDKNVQIRAIADLVPARLQACREDFEEKGVKDLLCFASLDELLASDVDAVLIATDKPYHAAHCIKALDMGKHVLSEIPTVSTIEEARALRAAVKAHPELKFMTAENCFYMMFVESWREMYRAGKFGDVIYAEAEYLHAGESQKPIPPESNHWRKYMNAINYLTHDLGSLLYIMDDRCVSVTCMEPAENKYRAGRVGKETGVALFRTEKGAIIRILISWGCYTAPTHNFALYGTRGSIMTDKTKQIIEAHCFASLSEIPGSFDRMFEIPVGLSLPRGEQVDGNCDCDAKMLRAFIQCIINDTEPPIDVDMGLRISIPGIIAETSAKEGSVCLTIPDERTL